MERHVMNFDGLLALQSCLGYATPTSFEVTSDCAEMLDEINKCLLKDDTTMLSRQTLSTLDIISKDLTPIITYTDDIDIYQNAIKLLRNLTDPFEVVLGNQIEVPCEVKMDIKRLYNQCKRCCIQHKFLTGMVRNTKKLIQQTKCLEMETKTREIFENSCLFLRNLLILVPNTQDNTDLVSNYLIKLIFGTEFNDVILDLVKLDIEGHLCVALSQLVFFLLRDYSEVMLKRCDRNDQELLKESCGVYDLQELSKSLDMDSENSVHPSSCDSFLV